MVAVVGVGDAMQRRADTEEEPRPTLAAGSERAVWVALVIRHAVRGVLEEMDSVFAVFLPREDRLSADEQALFDERQQARKDRDFARADGARQKLEALGVVLEDMTKGTRWRRKN